ncbi:MAG TPA: DUF2800 domain-containing protein, partial [Chitinophagaceae bacterium]|nr:DUF2800 domain-containing protein [Chitinophagaceae bacterium]
LDDEDISDILNRAKEFENWLKSVGDYALATAVNDGKKWPGLKLVEGRSNRVITEPDSVAKRLEALSYSQEQIWNKKIKGITDLEKLLGKKEFAAELGKWVVKPTGKPTLVPESDKREELSSTANAAADFEGVEIE